MNRFSKAVTAGILLALLIQLMASPLIATNNTSLTTSVYVSPILMNNEYWIHGAYVEDSAYLSISKPEEEIFKLVNDGEYGYVMLVMDRNAPITILKGKILGLVANLPTHVYNIAFVTIKRDQLALLANTPGVLAILPDIRLDTLINKEQEILNRLLNEDVNWFSEITQATGIPLGYHYTVDITGAYDVWTEYNIRGEDVTIAIIDTGVDYGSPGLGLGAIARDEYGLPMVFDASSLGLVLTPVKAVPTEDGYIVVDPAQLYLFWPPYYVYRWTNRLYIRVTGCRSFTGWLPFPADNKWYIGDIVYYGDIKFGLMFQYVSAGVATVQYTIPVITVDSNGDGFYDTVYVDTTTALYLLRAALSPAPCNVVFPGTLGTTPDFSFADEEPIRYGYEIVVRDLNEDGIGDYSIGTLAGYVYDAAFVIILEKIGVLKQEVLTLPPLQGISTAGPADVWEYEPVAYVWPGLDPYGDYVVLEYDYHSHGTFCATTAAGRDYYALADYTTRSISGQAPRAKIAASPALYYGTVAVSIYFFSGFDIATPYGEGSVYLRPALLTNPWTAFEGYGWKWTYTGLHQADITSNSYGISGWALWGWNTGMDPQSVIFDYTILKSGTLHFVAVGNGGPGYGTIASPAGSSLSVSVGAATEFTYRPAYGFHWPGSNRQVISWSNRGPTELGVVKPDIVAIGSFAWATGRTWDALRVRRFDGRYVHALFSGTSQATPMTAGASALVVSAYKSAHGKRMPAHLLKTIIMNNAYDMGFDELSQGAGFIDAYRAVKATLDSSYPKIYSYDIFRDVLSELGVNYWSTTHGDVVIGKEAWFEPKIFVPHILPGQVALRRLYIEGRGEYRLYSTRLEIVETRGFCDLVVSNIDPTIITSCSGESLTFNVTSATLYGHLVLDIAKLRKYDYFEIELIYPFQYFESGGRKGVYNNTIPTSILELAYWIDVGADGVFSWAETARMYYDIRSANALRIQVGDLETQIKDIEELIKAYTGFDPATLPRYLVVRIGVSGSTYRGVLPLKARVIGYQYKPWRDVIISPNTLSLRVGDRRAGNVIVRAPVNPGFYSGYIVVEEKTRGIKTLIPVSFFRPLEMRREEVLVIKPFRETTPRRNSYLRGVFDYTWRYESGDWRVFKVIIYPSLRNIWALGVNVIWPTHGNEIYASNLDVHVYGPYTYSMVNPEILTVHAYPVNGVQLGAELSRDPRGGGSYNPTRFWDSYRPGESLIIAQASAPGVYRIVVRNIQFSGLGYEEPFTLRITPIIASVVQGYNVVVDAYEHRVLMRSPDPSFLPLAMSLVGDGIVHTAEGAYYIENLTEYGLNVSIASVELVGNTLRAVVYIKPSPTVPKATYIIPIAVSTRQFVTTVGWLDSGVRNAYFEWNTIPLNIRLIHR